MSVSREDSRKVFRALDLRAIEAERRARFSCVAQCCYGGGGAAQPSVRLEVVEVILQARPSLKAENICQLTVSWY